MIKILRYVFQQTKLFHGNKKNCAMAKLYLLSTANLQTIIHFDSPNKISDKKDSNFGKAN